MSRVRLSIFVAILSLVSISTAYAQSLRAFEGCVYDRTTRKAVSGAAIQVWSPGGSVLSATTDATGCFSGGSLGFAAQSGGFIEASATIRKKHYRQQYLLPPNLDVEVGVDYHYDFFLDTLPRK